MKDCSSVKRLLSWITQHTWSLVAIKGKDSGGREKERKSMLCHQNALTIHECMDTFPQENRISPPSLSSSVCLLFLIFYFLLCSFLFTVYHFLFNGPQENGGLIILWFWNLPSLEARGSWEKWTKAKARHSKLKRKGLKKKRVKVRGLWK